MIENELKTRKKITRPPVRYGGLPFIKSRLYTLKRSNECSGLYTYLDEPGAFMSASYNRTIVKNFLKKIRSRFLSPDVLDAGSGLGFNLPIIFANWSGANVVALDLCKEALEVSNLCCNREDIIFKMGVLKRRYELDDWVIDELLKSRQTGFPGKQVDIAADDIIKYRKSAKRLFDVVICTEVLEHVDDLPGTLTSLCSLVNEKGYLILSFPNYYRNTAALIKKHQDKKTGTPSWSPWEIHRKGRENLINWITVKKIINKLDFTIVNQKAANYLLAWIPHLAKRFKREKTHNLGDSYPMIWLGDLFPPLRRFAMNYFILAKPKQSEITK